MGLDYELPGEPGPAAAAGATALLAASTTVAGKPRPQRSRRPSGEGRAGARLAAGLALGAVHLLALGGSKAALRGEFERGGGMAAFRPWLWLPAAATALYLLAVRLGNRAMAARPPIACTEAMVAYNAYQVVFNGWVVGSFVREMAGFGGVAAPKVWGNLARDTGFEVSFCIWMHYINKYSELLDTAFMVLRKKTEQISFLHVYHHVLLVWSWALVCQVEPGGDGYFGAMVNSLVHVLMYAYYLLAALKVPCPWKRYLTQIQMAQFGACAAQSFYVLARGNVPRVLALAQLFVMANMLYLFAGFYRERYLARGGGAGRGRAG